ncbi:bacterial capsule synthesis PGA_cap family protein [Paraburkholderia fungorum]|jgi:poly-gamma-glutamate capsule biosynthesis protein CapA/YwtB (metallophosphatase superfamily)|uniref:Bacterial capsule synthesis PGA_cap family protein n=2 Tax=Paraburkholderia fungorum TaxID=134537 RepID=A0AAP5QGZ1_9BURK|nr:CapA family protein [Paraburkholderia fungorum]AJZ56516.1 bacterial capsule synthesis PGA_cap family protein [Paraburkholderia fungorum]MDT8843518.1 CapA family protein [Paraburkholderia fungorum]
MAVKILLTGDINLMNVADPSVPFRQVTADLKAADFVFSNLECCLYAPDHGVAVDLNRTNEGFFADPAAGVALRDGGIQAVGIANNVNYGATAILSSIDNLAKLGIPRTGAGRNADDACAPVIVERNGQRIGVIQRTAVYWPTNHEASAVTPGVAALKGHTSYQIAFHRLGPDQPTPNRPGVPPVIHTYVDPKYLQILKDQVAELRKQVDIAIVSLHWGLDKEILEYMTELAHVSIDAGADLVIGHGPHYSLPVEIYQERPIFYGLGSFSFHTGHAGKRHGDWVGMMANFTVDKKAGPRTSFRFVRHNDDNETYLCDPKAETEVLEELRARSAKLGAGLEIEGQDVILTRLTQVS